MVIQSDRLRPIFSFACTGATSLALLFAAGCAESGPVMGTASGTVKFKDQPIPSGMLFIYNKETANADSSEIIDGRFTLGGQVPVGTYTVFVTAIPPEPGSPLERPKNFDGGGFPDVPQKYQMQDKSDLKVEIQEGTKEVEIVIPES